MLTSPAKLAQNTVLTAKSANPDGHTGTGLHFGN
jgi:hypothetical protein